jgi:hypothetical protein
MGQDFWELNWDLWQKMATARVICRGDQPQALSHRARFNRAARRGEYTPAMEKEMLATSNFPLLAKAAA